MKNNQVPFSDPRDALEWLMFICESVAASCNVLLHKQLGPRYLDVQGGFAIIVILIFSLFFPPTDVHGLHCFLGIYVLTGTCMRVGTARRRMRGIYNHTRYDGYPRLMRIFPRASELAIKRFVEPLLVVISGTFTLHLDHALGCYLIVASVAMFYSTNGAARMMRRRLDDLNDSIIEQREIGERLRQMNNNQL